MSYHTTQQRTAPGKFGCMPTFNRNSNGPIQPSTMSVVTSGGANRFTVENYLPSAEAPKPNPVRYTPSDLNLDDLLHTKRAPDPNEWLGPKIHEPAQYVYATNPRAAKPNDLNHRLNSLHFAVNEYDLTTSVDGLKERREGLMSAGLDVSRRPHRNPFDQALTSRNSTYSPYVAPAAYAVGYTHGAGWSQDKP